LEKEGKSTFDVHEEQFDLERTTQMPRLSVSSLLMMLLHLGTFDCCGQNSGSSQRRHTHTCDFPIEAGKQPL
jgi:hypothetical protein